MSALRRLPFLKRADVGDAGATTASEQIGLPLVAFVERTRRHAGPAQMLCKDAPLKPRARNSPPRCRG